MWQHHLHLTLMVLIPGGNVASKVSMYHLKSVNQGLDGSKFAADCWNVQNVVFVVTLNITNQLLEPTGFAFLDSGLWHFWFSGFKLYYVSISRCGCADVPSNSPHSLRRLEHLLADAMASSFWNKTSSGWVKNYISSNISGICNKEQQLTHGHNMYADESVVFS